MVAQTCRRHRDHKTADDTKCPRRWPRGAWPARVFLKRSRRERPSRISIRIPKGTQLCAGSASAAGFILEFGFRCCHPTNGLAPPRKPNNPCSWPYRLTAISGRIFYGWLRNAFKTAVILWLRRFTASRLAFRPARIHAMTHFQPRVTGHFFT